MNSETGELPGTAQQQLGSRYLVGKLIGRGAMGRVYAGTERDSGDPVAIKVLRPELVSDPETVARFLQERRILTSVSSPATVRIIDLVVEGETLAIVMELVNGEDLRRYLRARGTLPPAEAAGLAVQLLTGLAAVHAAGVVHRDIKPENLLLETASPGAAEGAATLKVTDFGVARLSYGSLTKLSSVIGTPEYMAPELADGGSAGPAADVYSAGVVLYEMLSSRTPFAGGSPVAMLRRHADMAPPPVPGLPPALWEQLSRMLAKDPAARPATAAEAAAALGALSAQLAPLPALPPLAEPASYQRVTVDEAAPVLPGSDTMTVIKHRDRGAPPAGPAVGGGAPPADRGTATGSAPRWRLAALLAGAAAVVIAAAAFVVPPLLHRNGPVPPGPTITTNALGETQAAATTTFGADGTSSASSPGQIASPAASRQQSTAPNGGAAPVVVPATTAAPVVTTAAPVVTTPAPVVTTHSSAPVQPAPVQTTTAPPPAGAGYASVALSNDSTSMTARAYFGQVSAVEAALAGPVSFGTLTSAGSDPAACVETVVFSQVTYGKAVVSAVGLGSAWRGAEVTPSSTTPPDDVVHQQLVAPPLGVSSGTSYSAGAELGAQLISGVPTSTFSLSLLSIAGSVQTWSVAGQAVSCDG